VSYPKLGGKFIKHFFDDRTISCCKNFG